MAEASISEAEDQVICPICLDLLKYPVTIPCGHSYCMSCIAGYWDKEDQKGVYSCPRCKQTFTPRPDLYKNKTLTDMEEKLKKTNLQAARPVWRLGGGDVECAVCTGHKNKAIKSCVVCLKSYCQNHLKEHDSYFQDERHKIIDASRRLQEMICPQHDKPLEYFCWTDQQCICYLCMMDEHKHHKTVTAAERTEKQVFTQSSYPHTLPPLKTWNMPQDKLFKRKLQPLDLMQAMGRPKSLAAESSNIDNLMIELKEIGDKLDTQLGANFLDDDSAKHMQLATLMKETGDALESKGFLLFKSINSGGNKVKIAFYNLLEKLTLHFFKDLGGVRRKSEPESPVPCKNWSDMILQYRTTVIDRCKFVTEYNPPSDELVELAARYTEPVIIQRSKEQNEKYCQKYVNMGSVFASSQLLSNDKNHSVTLDQLFSPDSDGNPPTTVILSGDSGRGKSFTLQKIMLDWASGELYSEYFDAVFLLKCEELKCISEEMSLIELLSWSCSITSDQISQMLELKPEKVLFLIDGMDEYVSHSPINFMLRHTNPSDRVQPMVTLWNLLRGFLQPKSFMVVTTRSIAADAVMNLLKGPQRFTEIVGFSERGVQEYFHKFFQDEQLFMKTYESVKANEGLMTACSVPLLCWMVCFCLKKHFTDDDHVMAELKTTTSIYVHFVSTLLEHHDQSQSALAMLRSLGQLAEEWVKKRQGLFVEWSVIATGLDQATCLFLCKDSLKRKNRLEPVFRFMHPSFQEIFTGLYYVLLDEKMSWEKVSTLLNTLRYEGIIDRPSPERRSNPIPSVMMFLCCLVNEEANSLLFKKINWTVPHTMKLMKGLQDCIFTMKKKHGCKLFALHCMYELHDEVFIRRALADWVSVDLSNISLRSTDCWVLLYCLQCCPHIRELNLMYCDLTSDQLKILQPAFCMCESLRFSVKHLPEVGDLIQILGESQILKKLKVQEDEYSAESPRWTLDLSVTPGEILLSLSSSEKNPFFPAVLSISLTCSHSEISSIDWTLFLQTLSKAGKLAEDSSALEDHVRLLMSSFPSVGLKTLDLKVFSLNESWASGIISLVQTCTSLQKLRLNISPPEPSEMNLHCQSCVHIADCDQWIQVEPSVCSDEGGSKFRISTQAGRFECSRTRMRWVCAGDVTLQYREVDGRSLSAELKRLQCERIGPVIDVTVISGKLEEAHLPHYACLAESDPALKDAVKLLIKRDEGISLQSVELTRYHAKILQPSFSLTTLIISWFMQWEEHCDLLLYMCCKDPLILHLYFFPVNDTCSKEKVKENEKANHLISHPRPNRPFRMKTPHLLEVLGAFIHPVEGISFRTDVEPNFFEIMQHLHGDVQMNLIREEDKKSVWTATIWKDKLAQLTLRQVQDEPLNSEIDKAQFFDNHRFALIQRVKNVKSIADKLLEQRIIHEELYSEITHSNLTSQDSMRKICYTVHSSGMIAKAQFILILQEEEPYLFEELVNFDS